MNSIVLALFLIIALAFAQTCKQPVVGKLGDACAGDMVANQTVSCVLQSACHPTSQTCVAPPAFEATCSSNANCTSAFGYACIDGVCTIVKQYNEPCKNNATCFSGLCEGGKCVGRSLGADCTADKECIFTATTQLFCGSNKTCEAYAAIGASCGVGANDGKCNPRTSVCFNSTCVAIPAENAACDPTGADAPATCQTTLFCAKEAKQCKKFGSLTTGQQCNSGSECAQGLACDTSVSPATCKTNTDVKCGVANGFLRCRVSFGGFCNCASGPNAEGVCTEGTVTCGVETLAFVNCLQSKCGVLRGSTFPWEANSCGSAQCLSERNAVACCFFKQPNSVKFPEFNEADCVAPTPTQLGPSVPQSSASIVAVNILTVIAIIAGLLL